MTRWLVLWPRVAEEDRQCSAKEAVDVGAEGHRIKEASGHASCHEEVFCLRRC
jgi:hypothetical protein